MAKPYPNDKLFAELDRQIAVQKDGGPRVNWTQFQLAIAGRFDPDTEIFADALERMVNDAQVLRHKMEQSFHLSSLDDHLAPPKCDASGCSNARAPFSECRQAGCTEIICSKCHGKKQQFCSNH